MRGSPKDVEDFVKAQAIRDGRDVKIIIEQEPGSSGVNTIDHYQRTVLVGFSVKGNRPTGSKSLRANPVSSAAEAGNISLLSGPWVEPFLDEAESFPFGTHDDQIDAVSGAFAEIAHAFYLPGHVTLGISEGPEGILGETQKEEPEEVLPEDFEWVKNY